MDILNSVMEETMATWDSHPLSEDNLEAFKYLGELGDRVMREPSC